MCTWLDAAIFYPTNCCFARSEFFPTFASDASSRLGKDATVFAIGGYGTTRSTETPARASAIGFAACSVTGSLNEISRAAGSTQSGSVPSGA